MLQTASLQPTWCEYCILLNMTIIHPGPEPNSISWASISGPQLGWREVTIAMYQLRSCEKRKKLKQNDGCDVFCFFCSQYLTTKYLCVCVCFFCYDTWDWLIYWTVDKWYFLDLCIQYINTNMYVYIYTYI